MEDFGACELWLLVCLVSREMGFGPSSTSKMARKIALSMVKVRDMRLPRRQQLE